MKAKPTRSDDTPVVVSSATPAKSKPVSRPFPGPRGALAPLRVAVDRAAHAELIAHAKESLHAEVCGVLVGEEGVDDEGVFLHVQAIIRGTQASGGSTHVTFTHETWDSIHKAMEKDYPRQRMVGWYHTHPGFGVEFSEMDLFIQKNFFSGASQIALVTDPVSGAVGIAMNAPEGKIIYLPRYWVEGREQLASVPASMVINDASAASGAVAADVQALEHRLNQMTLAVEDLRTSLHRALLFAGFLLALGVIVATGTFIRDMFRERVKPPEVSQYAPVPVKIGDKNVLLGVAVLNWQIPDELNGLMIDVEKARQEEEAAAKAKAEAAKAESTNSEPAKEEPAKTAPAKPADQAAPVQPQAPAPSPVPGK